MARYKRRRRGYRRNSTNVIKMKFQSFMDISTDVDSMKIIQISAGGKHLLERCPLQFGAYKYYKIGNISVKLVPASTLPADPTGLSYTAGDNATIDPRDQLSPGLMRITNGEDIFTNLTGVSDEAQHKIYNSMMLDPRWFKWMLQRGVKRHATPRYWQIGQLHQDKWPGAIMNYPAVDGTTGDMEGTESIVSSGDIGVRLNQVGIDGSSPYGFFQTGHRGILGWLPTDGLQPVLDVHTGTPGLVDMPLIASPAEVNVFTLVLPKAYKTRYYYRAFISETVYFKEPIVSVGTVDNEYAPLDVFHRMMLMNPSVPTALVSNQVYDERTGGNYGDN